VPLGALELLTPVARVWHACGTGVEAQRAPIRILYEFPGHHKEHCKESKEGYEEGNKDQDFIRVS